MSRLSLILLSIPVVLAIIVFAGLWILAKQSAKSTPVRLSERNLKSHSEKPNYVSSRVEDPERFIEPLAFEGDPGTAWTAAIKVVGALPDSEIVTEESQYLHAMCRTSLFGFVDDLELQLAPEEKLIHIRSESRVGRSDMGANRKRVELLRSQFQDLLGQ